MAEDTTIDTTIGKTMEELLEEFKNAQVADRQNIIIQAAELQDYEEKKEQRNEELKKLLDDGIKKQMGETGFRGIIKTSKEGFTKLLTSQKSMSELFGDLKSSFSTDLSFITMALSPLTAIPGISTAIAIIKFAFKALWKGIQMFWAWQKAMRLKDDARARLTGLATEKPEGITDITTEKKNWFLTFFGKLWKIARGLVILIGAVIVGFFLALTKPFRVVTGFLWRLIWPIVRGLGLTVGGWIRGLGTRFFGPTSWLRTWINPQLAKVAIDERQAIANYNKQLAAGTFQKSGMTGGPGRFVQAMTTARTWFSGLTTRVSGIFATIKNSKIITGIMNFFRSIGSGLQAIAKSGIVRFALRLTGWLTAWVIAPIVAIIGFFEGFTTTEGSFWDKLKGGFLGAIWGLFDFFILFWADLGTRAIAAVGKLFGFDMSWLTDWTTALWAALKAGFMAMVPGGDTPLEAFSKKWTEVMSASSESDVTPDATNIVKAPGPTKAESIVNYERMRLRDTGGSDTAAGRALAAFQNNSITNNNTNISVLESVIPGDPMAAALAAQFE